MAQAGARGSTRQGNHSANDLTRQGKTTYTTERIHPTFWCNGTRKGMQKTTSQYGDVKHLNQRKPLLIMPSQKFPDCWTAVTQSSGVFRWSGTYSSAKVSFLTATSQRLIFVFLWGRNEVLHRTLEWQLHTWSLFSWRWEHTQLHCHVV